MTRRAPVQLLALAVALAASGCAASKPVATRDRGATAVARPADPIPAVGSTAPDFTLPGPGGAEFKLSDARGYWVVLQFHNAADLPLCACQATPHTSVLESLRDLDAMLLTVSDLPVSEVDDRQQRYALAGYILADPEHATIERWGLWTTEPDVAGRRIGRVRHASFLIDPQGRIAERWVDFDPTDHAARVRAGLERHGSDN